MMATDEQEYARNIPPGATNGAPKGQPSAYSDTARGQAIPPHRPTPATIGSILETWQTEGPLVHEPTGFQTLDDETGGGPVYGSRWYWLGQPDACKTAVVVQIADRFLSRGLVVGMQCIDEEPGDVAMRFMQRRGFGRVDCEKREPFTLSQMKDSAAELERLRLYDPSWTIETAAADLAKFATEQGARAAFFTDSIQAAANNCPSDANSLREAVTSRVIAFREAATRYRLIGIATSEMGRGHYIANADSDDMASAKESGAIEYSARVMLTIRAVPNEDDLFVVKLAKNKHGRRGGTFGLHLDRRLMALSEAEAPAQPDRSEAREQARVGREDGRNRAAAVAAVAVLTERPGLSTRDLTPAMRVRMGSCSATLAGAGLAMLGAALVQVPGARGAIRLYLNGPALPPLVAAALDPDALARAVALRGPKEGSHAD